MWDGDTRTVIRCFLIPRGISVIAGGTVEPGATSFTLKAELGSETFGICSNPYLDAEFKTIRYEVQFTVLDSQTIHYAEDTVIKIKDSVDLFHHTDENTLARIAS
jgi:hypothetical protein